MLSDVDAENLPQSPLYPPREMFPTVPDCPFCIICKNCPPARNPQVVDGPIDKAYIVLSTPSVIAFLDIAPVSKGHVLICPRAHDETIADVKAEEAAVLGFWLPILSRGVMTGVCGKEDRNGKSWNLVQANGEYSYTYFGSYVIWRSPSWQDQRLTQGLSRAGNEAGQTVPHTHFHIIPRLGGGKGGEEGDTLNAQTRGFEVAVGREKKLDAGEAMELMKSIKDGVREEVDRLRGSGEITDGRFLWEYWGSVEGRRGLKL